VFVQLHDTFTLVGQVCGLVGSKVNEHDVMFLAVIVNWLDSTDEV